MPALDRAKTMQAAEKHVRAGKLLDAAKEYQKLADDNPRDMNIVNKLGDLLLRAGRTPDALKQFMRIADFFAKDGFHLKAIAMYKKIAKIDPANLESQQRLAALYHRQGLATEAKAQYVALADALQRAGQAQPAAEALRRLLQIDPDNVKVRLRLAEMLGRGPKPEEAALEYAHVARVAAQRGALDETVQVVRKAMKISPAHPDLPAILLQVVTRLETAPADLVAAAEEIVRHARRSGLAIVLLGESLRRAGRLEEAETAMRRLGEESFDDELEPLALFAVSEFHGVRGRTDEAYEWLERGIERCVAAGQVAGAVGALEAFLGSYPKHTRALRRRGELAARAGDAESEAQTLMKLAPVLMESGDRDQARDTLSRLQTLRPDDDEVVELKNRLERGGDLAAPPEPQPEPETAAPPVVRAAASAAPAGAMRAEAEDAEAAEIFNLDEEPELPEPAVASGADDADAIAIEIDVPSVEEAAEEDYGPKSRIQEIQNTDAATGQPIDEEFISEHLTEAEVFVKYGLLDKAREQLKQVLQRYPQHDVAHLRMKEIAVGEGNKDAAVRACLALASIRRDQGKEDEARELINEAVKIDPEHSELAEYTSAQPAPRIVPAAPAPPPVPAAAPAPKPMAPPRAAAPPPAPPPRPKPAAAPPDDALELDLDLSEDDTPAAEPSRPVAAKGAGAPAADFATTTARTVLPLSEGLEEEAADDLDVLREALSEPDAEKLGEVDFYIEQGLVDEARQVLFQLKKRFPGSDAVEERITRLEKPAAAPAAGAASDEPEAGDVDFEVEQALAGKSAGGERSPAAKGAHQGAPSSSAKSASAPARAAAPAEAKPSGPKPAAAKGTPKAGPVRPVFKVETPVAGEDDGDFFDLAAELESTLEEEHAQSDQRAKADLDGQVHTFEDIFAAFRKGVEQQVDSDDFDTHYNLGIAYKEMGLVDEAIGEFQFAAKDPNRALECCGILGLCFRDKGMPDLALKWYRRGLDMPGLGEQQVAGFRYDMAEVYRDKGEFDEALRMYTEVFGVDSAYRDVASRIKEMRSQLAQSGKR
jgi:tetratricopeptide (TPR) repeat protein